MSVDMDIHRKYVDMDMDMDVKFHIHGNPANIWYHTKGQSFCYFDTNSGW